MKTLLALLAFCWGLPVLAETVVPDATSSWEYVVAGLERNDLSAVNDGVQDLRLWARQAGIANLESYSALMIEEGLRRVDRNDFRAADVLLRLSVSMSPTSPRIAFDAVPLSAAVGGAGTIRQLYNTFLLLVSSPTHLLEGIAKGVYPVLWALTLAAYFTFALFFAFWAGEYLRRLAPKLPKKIRGMATPIIGLTLLGAPVLFGPLVAIPFWALLAWSLFPRPKWAVTIAGLTLVGWGLGAPYRLSTERWLSKPEMNAVLRVIGSHTHGDELIALGMTDPATRDDLTWFVYGQLLRKENRLAEAEKALKSIKSDQPWVSAELGVVYTLAGRMKEAVEAFDAAENQGLGGAQLYFNRSKVSFDEFDTASAREHLARAERDDPQLTGILKEREGNLGVQHPMSYADVRPGLLDMMATTWLQEFKSALSQKAPGAPCSSGVLLFFGGVFLLLPLRSGRSKPERINPYYAAYETNSMIALFVACIPGGSWIPVPRPFLTYCSLALLFAMVLPILGWPADMHILEPILRYSEQAYIALTLVVAIALSVAGLAFAKE